MIHSGLVFPSSSASTLSGYRSTMPVCTLPPFPPESRKQCSLILSLVACSGLSSARILSRFRAGGFVQPPTWSLGSSLLVALVVLLSSDCNKRIRIVSYLCAGAVAAHVGTNAFAMTKKNALWFPPRPIMPGRRTRSPSPEYSRKRSKHENYPSARDSPSPTMRSSIRPSKPSRYEDDYRDRRSDRPRDRDRRDRSRDRDRDRDRERERDRERDKRRSRSPRDRYERDRDRERDRYRDRDRERERERERERGERERERDREKGNKTPREDRERTLPHTPTNGHSNINGTATPSSKMPLPASQFKSATASSASRAVNSPAPPPRQQPEAISTEEEERRKKKERLEAWKREREAKKALNDAKAKAMALAGKTAPPQPSCEFLHHSDPSLPLFFAFLRQHSHPSIILQWSSPRPYPPSPLPPSTAPHSQGWV